MQSEQVSRAKAEFARILKEIEREKLHREVFCALAMALLVASNENEFRRLVETIIADIEQRRREAGKPN